MISAQSAGGQATAKILRQLALDRYYANPNYCKHCKKLIIVLENQKVPEVRAKQFCNHKCAAEHSNRKRHEEKFPGEPYPKGYTPPKGACSECNTSIHIKSKTCRKCQGKKMRTRESKTKKDLIISSKFWGEYRTPITKNAREVYKNSGKPYKCLICNYTLHVDICHIKDVSKFSNESTVKEINHPDNLEALCRNHHWEFDHGHIEINGTRKPKKR